MRPPRLLLLGLALGNAGALRWCEATTTTRVAMLLLLLLLLLLVGFRAEGPQLAPLSRACMLVLGLGVWRGRVRGSRPAAWEHWLVAQQLARGGWF